VGYIETLSRNANTLKKTLNKVMVDEGRSERLILNKYLHVTTMTDAWEDDLDKAGPGLASERGEAEPIVLGSTQEGDVWRYIATTYALKMQATKELLEDGKYEKAIDLQKFNRDCMWVTCEYLAAGLLINRANTSYLGGDGVPLGSDSHRITVGGTYSNLLSTPAGPSMSGIELAVSSLLVMPGRDGLIQSVMPRAAVYPANQWGSWARLLRSEKDPTPGNFTAVNVLRSEDWNLRPVMVPFWQGAPNDWAILTDASDGPQWRWRRKPHANSWVDNNIWVMNSSIQMRVAPGWSNPRGIFFGGSAT